MSPKEQILLPNADGVSKKNSTSVPMHTSPLGMQSGMVYPQIQRSSPTTATAVASATVTIQNVPNFATRGTNFQYPMGQVDYRQPDRQKQSQYMPQPGYASENMYNPDHPTINDGQPYFKNNQLQNNATSTRRSRQTYPGYSNQHYGTTYNYKNHTSEYHHNINQYPQGYDHTNYNYNQYPASMYSNEENMHLANPIHENNYYQNENQLHQMHTKVQNAANEYQNKYYENSYNSPQMAPTTEGYMPTEVYPNSTGTGGIMTPPTSVQTDTSENYPYHQFYQSDSQTVAAPAGENSNSSSDFNFLSNLANDYTPEYYQI